MVLISVCSNGTWVFFSSLILLENHKLKHDWGEIHCASIFLMIITSDDKTIFTADRVNVLKQWNIGNFHYFNKSKKKDNC